MDDKKITKEEVIDQLLMMIQAYEKMPTSALYQPVTHSDFQSFLLLLYASLRAED